MCFTGCRSPRELSSRSLCWLLTVFGVWGRRISRASVFPCLTTLPSPVFVLLNATTCSFLERGRSWEQGASAWLPLLRSTSVSRDTFKSRLKSHFYADAYLHQVWERVLRQTMTLTLTLTLTFVVIVRYINFHLIIIMFVHRFSTGEFDLLPEHHDHRVKRRCNHSTFLTPIFTPTWLCAGGQQIK